MGSPLERRDGVNCGSAGWADLASTAHRDRRSTWTRCRLWVASPRTKAVMGVKNAKIVNGPTH